MKSIFRTLGVLMIGATLSTSCLNSDDDQDLTVYSDMAITSFAISGINRYYYVTSTTTGSDSLVKAALTGTSYKITIDQLGHTIYNQTELPLGTDLKHVLCTVTTKNNGVVAIKSMTSDSLMWYSSKDSIDFSVPRIFRVYAIDNSGWRDYTVTLTASKTTGLTFQWTKVGTADVSDFANMRLEAMADTVQLVAKDSIIGRSTNECYTIGAADGQLKCSRDGGLTWTVETTDEPDSLLPARNAVATVCWDYAPADDTDYVLMVGMPQQNADTQMRVWRKITHHSNGGQWVYIPQEANNPYTLPLISQPSLVWYDGTVLAVSAQTVYQSRDQGITWKEASTYALPSALAAGRVLMAADQQGRLWAVADNGDVWMGAKK